MHRHPFLVCMLSVGVALAGGAPARADWALVDNFEGYEAPVTFTNGGTGPGAWASSWSRTGIKVEADGGNRTMNIYKTLTSYATLATAATEVDAASTAATLFFRFRKNGTAWDSATHYYLGLAEDAAADHYNDLNVRMLIYKKDFIYDDGAATVDPTGSPDDLLQDGTWMNVWLVLDNAADTYSVYTTTGDAAATGTDPVVEDLGFATPSAGALRAFSVGMDTNRNNTPLELDDIHLDAGGVNLGMPAPEPATLALAAVGAAACVRRRRRRR